MRINELALKLNRTTASLLEDLDKDNVYVSSIDTELPDKLVRRLLDRFPQVAEPAPKRPRADRRSKNPISPSPREIWMADIPYRENNGKFKPRPCVVLETYRGGAVVLQSRGSNPHRRDDLYPEPAFEWYPGGKTLCSWIDLSRRIDLPISEFYKRMATTCSNLLWAAIEQRHRSAGSTY